MYSNVYKMDDVCCLMKFWFFVENSHGKKEGKKRERNYFAAKFEIYVHNTLGPLIFPYRIPRTMYTCSLPAIDIT